MCFHDLFIETHHSLYLGGSSRTRSACSASAAALMASRGRHTAPSSAKPLVENSAPLASRLCPIRPTGRGSSTPRSATRALSHLLAR
eukprot:scaffold103437_cov69-Phaeocystis_antarctica.AAC.5